MLDVGTKHHSRLRFAARGQSYGNQNATNAINVNMLKFLEFSSKYECHRDRCIHKLFIDSKYMPFSNSRGNFKIWFDVPECMWNIEKLTSWIRSYNLRRSRGTQVAVVQGEIWDFKLKDFIIIFMSDGFHAKVCYPKK